MLTLVSIAQIFFTLANIFLVIVPLVPPAAGAHPNGGLPYYLHVVVGFGIIALGAVYWVIWARVLPQIGERCAPDPCEAN